MSAHHMDSFFKPRSVAVIGATDRPGAVGRTILENLIRCRTISAPRRDDTFALYPVNPNRTVCGGLQCYPDVGACPPPVDLAVVVTPAPTVYGVVESCGKAGVAGVIVITAGFKETGDEGARAERDIVAMARRYNMRLIGPNCLGVMAPHTGLNATFAATDAEKGGIAFVSQSGAMCTAMLDWSRRERVGFSAFVSIGSMAEADWADLIAYLGTEDTKTQSILMYMETIGERPEAFLRACTTVAARKPLLVIKAGRTTAAAQAAASHTGSLAGSHDAFCAAMRRAGVMIVETIPDLLDCALMLGKQPLPSGPNLVIITNAGGPGVLATDAAVANGAEILKLSSSTVQRLNQLLPAAWSHGNPIDILGDASADLYAKALAVALETCDAHGLLVILSPQSVTDPSETARAVVDAVHSRQNSTHTPSNLTAKKAASPPIPVFCAWMGGDKVNEGFTYLRQHDIPVFACPDTAARVFANIWKHRERTITRARSKDDSVIESLLSQKSLSSQRPAALRLLRDAADTGRVLLTEVESKELLRLFGLPVAATLTCFSEDEALEAAETQVKFPCVMKLHSKTITHKSDVGGVQLNLRSAECVQAAWKAIQSGLTASVGDANFKQHFHGVTIQPMLEREKGIELILGSSTDPQFGPLVLFGTGGCLVEIYKDTVLGIPPLSPSDAEEMLASTKIYNALRGNGTQRFPGIDLEVLRDTLCRFSNMVTELAPYVVECDINPLLAFPDRVVSLDARFVLKPLDQWPMELSETTVPGDREVPSLPVCASASPCVPPSSATRLASPSPAAAFFSKPTLNANVHQVN